MSALRGADEPDGGGGVREEGEVLGSLAAALQATAEVLTTVTGEDVEREEREGKWRAGIVQELMVEAVRDMAWLVSSHNTCQFYVYIFKVLVGKWLVSRVVTFNVAFHIYN